ncbi:cysteine hydrolase [Candidatus Woesearchaeota archaeon]|nr:cysteine hydrolase [Candidatus Woesearchaeota archaeon]
MREKTIFWNVDTQADFMCKSGALYIVGAESIEDNLGRLTWHASEHNIQVVNTADWHDDNTEEIAKDEPDFIMTFPAHCMKGTVGSEYVPATKPSNPYVVDWDAKSISLEEIAKNREIVIRKDKFDVFAGNPHARQVLDAINPRRVIIYGLATNYCVNFAVQGLLKKEGLEVYVVKDAIKEIALPKENDWNHEKVLKKWEDAGVKLVTTNQVLKMYR